MELNSGEILALLGPNGAGKTTLLRLAAGLILPSNGEIFLDGQPLSSLGSQQRARKLAIVFQNQPQPFEFTGYEIVSMGRNPYLSPWASLSLRDREIIERSMQQVEILELATRRFNKLSGGEQQLFYLARSLTQEPKILLLDEPTANLDVKYQLQIMKIVEKLVGTGVGVLMVTHNVNQAAHHAHKIALVKGGRLVKYGKPSEVITVENLKLLYDTDVVKIVNNGLAFYHFTARAC